MQAADDDALAAAVTARTRRPLARVRADWHRDGDYEHPLSDLTPWLESVEVERSLTSDLPVEAGLVDGFASAEATVVLSGRRPSGEHAADALSAYDESSPLYGDPLVTSDLQIDLGLATADGPRLLRQFTGPIRSVAADHVARTVEVAALDPADRIRALVTLPNGSLTRATYRDEPRAYPWTTNSQWVIDFLLRRNGVFASPAPHPDAVFSATLHGSHIAEIAAQSFNPRSEELAGPYPGSWFEVADHPFGMLHPRGDWEVAPSCQHVAAGPLPLGVGEGVGFSAWAKYGEWAEGTTDRGGDRRLVFINLAEGVWIEAGLTGEGGVYSRFQNGDDGNTVALSPDNIGPEEWRFVGVHVAFTDFDRFDFILNIGGNIWILSDVEIDSPVELVDLHASPRVSVYQPVQVSNVAVWSAPLPPSGAWPGQNHTSEADLDPGLNELTYLPEVTAEDSWEVLQDVVNAEFGVLGFDEWGRFFFRARDSTAADVGTVERTFHTSASIKELASEVNSDTIRNAIGWSSQNGFVAADNEIIYESEDRAEFHTIGGVTLFDIPIPPLTLIPLTAEVPHLTAAQWEAFDETIVWGYAASFNVDNAEVPNDQGLIRVEWDLIGPRLGRLTVYNNTRQRVNFALPGSDGEARLRLYGTPIALEPEVVGERVRPGSIALHGERGFKLPASPWRQLAAPQNAVAGSLLGQLATPIPVIEDVPVIGDPRLQIGDTVRLVDRDRLQVRATVVKINRGYGATDGLADTISVRPLAPPGYGVLDDDRLGRLDDTLILAP